MYNLKKTKSFLINYVDLEKLAINNLYLNQSPTSNTEHYVTLFDSNFLAQGLSLYYSLLSIQHDFVLWVICINSECFDTLSSLNLPRIHLIDLSSVESEELLSVKSSRSIAEYCWTVTPFAPDFVFQADSNISRLTYIDADLYFLKSPKPIFQELIASGKSILITEHNYARIYDQSSKAGKFCVQFVSFDRVRSSPARIWWQKKCIDWCFNRYEDNKFGDQKYLESFPKLFPDEVHILKNKSTFQAPWNAIIFPPSECIVFHFHGLRLLDKRKSILLASKHYDIPRQTIKIIYSSYMSMMSSILKSGMIEWHEQASMPSLSREWLKETILFILQPFRLFRKPRKPRIYLYKIFDN